MDIPSLTGSPVFQPHLFTRSRQFSQVNLNDSLFISRVTSRKNRCSSSDSTKLLGWQAPNTTRSQGWQIATFTADFKHQFQPTLDQCIHFPCVVDLLHFPQVHHWLAGSNRMGPDYLLLLRLEVSWENDDFSRPGPPGVSQLSFLQGGPPIFGPSQSHVRSHLRSHFRSHFIPPVIKPAQTSQGWMGIYTYLQWACSTFPWAPY